MGVAQRRRDDQLRHLAADRLLRGVAECLLGRPVELEHPALMVHRDDAVERGREHRALARLARADRLLGPGALDLLAELEPDRHHQVEQVVVGLGLLLGEELDHTDESAHRADREGERAVHPALCGNGRAREVRVDRDVPDPGRRLALPHASGQALPGCEAGLATLLLERLRLARRVGRVPALDAADALPIPAHLPQRAESPSERPADNGPRTRAGGRTFWGLRAFFMREVLGADIFRKQDRNIGVTKTRYAQRLHGIRSRAF